MVDLPSNAALIGGLEFWTEDRKPIYEDRLVAKLEAALGRAGIQLFAPPVDPDDPSAPVSGIWAWEFPEWFLAQYEDESRAREGIRSRPLIPAAYLVKGKYETRDRKKHAVVPVRFVQACVNGHLSDIDWRGFIHGAEACGARGFWLDERGTGGELVDVLARCDCRKVKSLADATLGSGRDAPLGWCKGERPWLGKGAAEGCDQWNRLLVRSASNAYFPQVLSVISIPDPGAALRAAVDRVYQDDLQYAESIEDIRRERKKQKIHNALEGFSDEAVWADVQRRKGGHAPEQRSVKQAEIEMLLASPAALGDARPEGIFHARTVTLDPASRFAAHLDRLVRVDRLREVTAQVGFTRFESVSPDPQGELNLEVRRAPLAREATWLPAVENRGEGVFLSFRGQAVRAWEKRPAVRARGDQFIRGFQAWQRNHHTARGAFAGLPYVMLHTLSHLLIQAVVLDCGYSASSIRERIYAVGDRFGVLLHTGTPDAEGTLGGLVQVTRRIEHHLLHAIELGRLCSNDPVCAQHAPDQILEERFLHGAACHGCALIAEPSCERRNELLDRALVVPTVDTEDCAFFADLAA
ncbi:MAG: hypothetical protein DCC71_02695 [Proteobacteria bacterium]|nr:MAG: hypothetical protein DCC71_02695 [Pseudomonadota bacterium]